MNSTALASALNLLRDTVRTDAAALHPALRREIGELCLQLFATLSQDLLQCDDPRLVLQSAQQIEKHYRYVLRAQLQATAAAEATGAHTLSTEEYNGLKNGTTNWDRPAEHASGRTAHKNTTAVMAAWLGLNEYETLARLQDTHRIIARRTMAGTAAAPRYAKLSALFLDPTQDPRPARDAARRLEKFEPTDQIQQGTALEPRAAGPDGVPLEDHAIRLLQQNDRITASKRIGELCTAYKEANTQSIKPTEYLRRVRTVMGVDIYQLAVSGENAETMRSLLAQLDNPNTKAGKAARATAGEDPAAPRPASETTLAKTSVAPPLDHTGQSPPTAPWLSTNDPAPQWAIDPDAQAQPTSDPGATAPRLPTPAASPSPRTTALADPELPPRSSTDTELPGPEAPEPEPQITVEKRRLKGFMAVLKQRTTASGASTQVVPTINVYMQLSQLWDLATAHGITAHGIKIGAAELRRMLCDANILPHTLGGQGQVLDQGRAKRTYTRTQRQSMLARDRGCIYPGCTYPPELCEAHHWDQGGWAGGCPTNVDQGAMTCPRHHDDYHAGKFRIVAVNGLPHVVQPPYLDPTQTPRRNQYWFGVDEPIPGQAPRALPPQATGGLALANPPLPSTTRTESPPAEPLPPDRTRGNPRTPGWPELDTG